MLQYPIDDIEGYEHLALGVSTLFTDVYYNEDKNCLIVEFQTKAKGKVGSSVIYRDIPVELVDLLKRAHDNNESVGHIIRTVIIPDPAKYPFVYLRVEE